MPEPHPIIADTEALAALCGRLGREPYVCIDTEFLRERTFWPVLCLVQIGGPEAGSGDAHLIDPLADGIDLAPFYGLLADPGVVKVLHAGSQDVEIFLHCGGVVPEPLFDTQIAASVCGLGDQASYGTVVQRLVGARVDKAVRSTDWSHRPLDARQAEYALTDVEHLPAVYQKLKAELAERGREEWIAEEAAALVDPARYDTDPREAWRRLKIRTRSGKHLAVLRELAAWREQEARRRDVPRRQVMSDDMLREIMGLCPTSDAELDSLRVVGRRRNKMSAIRTAVLAAVRRGLDCPPAERPVLPALRSPDPAQAVLGTLLKLLLRALSADTGVAEGIVASAADLERLAMEEEPDIPLLSGWRREKFGEELLRLKRGETALTGRGGRVVPVAVDHLKEDPQDG